MSSGHAQSGGAPGGAAAASPRDSATLVLMREGAHDRAAFEVCLLQRAGSMAVAPGHHVFPGGVVEPGDHEDPGAEWAGPRPVPWTETTPTDPGRVRAFVRAAVRETFEEVGVLLAGRTPDSLIADVSGAGWEADRRAVAAGELPFGQMLSRRSLVLRTDLVRPWARWITPALRGRRFDTRFFVGLLPEGQEAHATGDEADGVQWVTPAGAVEGWRQGRLAMLPPTVETLRRLARCGGLEEVFSAAVSMDPIQPEVRAVGGRRAIVTPGGNEYPLPSQRGR